MRTLNRKALIDWFSARRETLRGVDTLYTIGGGAIRDLLLDKEVRDLDISCSVGHMGTLRRRFGIEIACSEHPEQGDDKYEHLYIYTIEKGYSELLGHSVELIGINPEIPVDAKSVSDRICNGLCKVAWDNKNGLYIDPMFYQDVDNRTMTLVEREWGRAGVDRHTQKLLKKFPDFRVIDLRPKEEA